MRSNDRDEANEACESPMWRLDYLSSMTSFFDQIPEATMRGWDKYVSRTSSLREAKKIFYLAEASTMSCEIRVSPDL